MKKVLSVFVIMMFVFTVMAPVYAGQLSKLKDGVEQFFTSPWNVIEEVKAEYEASEFKPFGVIGGSLKGIFDTVVDAGGGLIDALTFYIDNKE